MPKGFSLIELLLVLVLLGALMVWMLPRYLQTVQKEQQTRQSALNQVRALQGALNTRGQQQQLQLDQLERVIEAAPRQTGELNSTSKRVR